MMLKLLYWKIRPLSNPKLSTHGSPPVLIPLTLKMSSWKFLNPATNYLGCSMHLKVVTYLSNSSQKSLSLYLLPTLSSSLF